MFNDIDSCFQIQDFLNYTLRWTNIAMENWPFEDVSPLKMVIFHCHISLLEGKPTLEVYPFEYVLFSPLFGEIIHFD